MEQKHGFKRNKSVPTIEELCESESDLITTFWIKSQNLLINADIEASSH